MGTNYYAIPSLEKVVETTESGEVTLKFNNIEEMYCFLEHYKNNIHIGKRSGGWKFLFQDQPGCFSTYEEFVKWLNINVKTNKYTIKNEYEEEVPMEQMLDIINMAQQETNINDFTGCDNRNGYRFLKGDFS